MRIPGGPAAIAALCALLSAAACDSTTPDPDGTLEQGTLDRFAGNWQVRVRNEAGDTLPSHRLVASADTAAWSVIFTNRPPVRVRVLEASGDVVVIETHPYESVVQAGVTVRSLFAHRLTGRETSEGRLWASYQGTNPPPLLRATTEGTRVP